MPRIALNTIGSIPNHKLQKNLKLDNHYISNDGGDEGISIQDDGDVIINGATKLFLNDAGGEYLTSNGTNLTIASGGDITLDAGSGAKLNIQEGSSTYASIYETSNNMVFDVAAGSGSLVIDGAGDNAGMYIGVNASTYDTCYAGLNGAEGGFGGGLILRSIVDTGDHFKIATKTNGVTTISTVDDDGVNADLTLNIDGFIDINSAAGENIILDAGGGIYLDAENGECRLTDDSAGSDVFTPAHDADITTKKYVDDNLHAESHTVASHSDTTATGAELETLTDGSDASALHLHDTSKFYYHFIKIGVNYSYIAGTRVFLPTPGAESARELSSSSGGPENFTWVCPYDGTLEKVQVRSEEVCGSSIVGFWHTAATVEIPGPAPISEVTVNMSVDDTTYEFDFTGETNTFSKGDIIMFSFDPTSDANDVQFMITLKLDVTT